MPPIKYSLSSDNTCVLSGAGDQNGVPARLNLLALVGGLLPMHLPRANSLLVDMVIGSDYPTTDQRGYPRPQGVGADAGAVERQSTDPDLAPILYLPLVTRQN